MCLPSTIAIDGPAAAGKSTIGYLLAQELGYIYFDTGSLYRAVTWAGLQRHCDLQDGAAMAKLAHSLSIEILRPEQNDGRYYTVMVDGMDVTWQLRGHEVDANVSIVSAHAPVRQSLLEHQRRIARKGHIVMVGRDIGSVVLPDADLKLYFEATPQERARRRWLELQQRGAHADIQELLSEIERRDALDQTRQASPLRKAADALVINTDVFTIIETYQRVLEIVRQHCKREPVQG
ncbi:MAG: (d)CMP kinase [Chloroflexi bacterium]|nr:(d)CMP kinase [Chloroflexota bacterium]